MTKNGYSFKRSPTYHGQVIDAFLLGVFLWSHYHAPDQLPRTETPLQILQHLSRNKNCSDIIIQVAIILRTSIDLETRSSGTNPSALGERRIWRPLFCTCCEINIMALTALKWWQVESDKNCILREGSTPPLFSQIRSQDNSVCVSEC